MRWCEDGVGGGPTSVRHRLSAQARLPQAKVMYGVGRVPRLYCVFLSTPRNVSETWGNEGELTVGPG